MDLLLSDGMQQEVTQTGMCGIIALRVELDFRNKVLLVHVRRPQLCINREQRQLQVATTGANHELLQQRESHSLTNGSNANCGDQGSNKRVAHHLRRRRWARINA